MSVEYQHPFMMHAHDNFYEKFLPSLCRHKVFKKSSINYKPRKLHKQMLVKIVAKMEKLLIYELIEKHANKLLVCSRNDYLSIYLSKLDLLYHHRNIILIVKYICLLKDFLHSLANVNSK